MKYTLLDYIWWRVILKPEVSACLPKLPPSKQSLKNKIYLQVSLFIFEAAPRCKKERPESMSKGENSTFSIKLVYVPLGTAYTIFLTLLYLSTKD